MKGEILSAKTCIFSADSGLFSIAFAGLTITGKKISAMGRNSFFFEPVTSMELETEILLLPTNKAHGLYSCPVRVLKSFSSVLSLPLAQIMNNSVLTGQYPSKLKHAKVTPIPSHFSFAFHSAL